MNKRQIFLVFAAIVLSLLLSVNASADAVDFSAKALLPRNQQSKQTYFDLRMESGQQQTVEVEIYNSSTIPARFAVTVNTAFTGPNGLIAYSASTERDDSMFIALSDIASPKQTSLLIPASSSAHVPITINMPQKRFDGILLGGVHITQERDLVTDTSSKNGVAISNKYAYVIGIRLSETDTHVKPDLHLKGVKPALVNHHTAIVANLQNSASIDVQKLVINAKIYLNDNKTPMEEVQRENISMAPNSNFDFSFDWKDRIIAPGKYRVNMTAENEDGRWEWNETFVITQEAADNTNDNAAILVNPIPRYAIMLILLIVLLLLMLWLGFWLGRRKKAKK